MLFRSVSRQLHHLIDLGFVVKVADPADGRASLVSVTDAARQRLDEVVTQRRRWVDERLGEWTAEELEDFVAELARYNASLDGAVRPPADCL